MQQFLQFYYPDVYLQLNMFRVSSCPSPGACNCSSSLWFYLRILVIAVLLFVFRPEHKQQNQFASSNGMDISTYFHRG